MAKYSKNEMTKYVKYGRNRMGNGKYVKIKASKSLIFFIFISFGFCASATSDLFPPCPLHFIPVLENEEFGTGDFCVEAKAWQDDFQDTNQTKSKISFDDAIQKCRELNHIYQIGPGKEFDLIAKREWESINRSIEQNETSLSGDTESEDEGEVFSVLFNGKFIYFYKNFLEWVRETSFQESDSSGVLFYDGTEFISDPNTLSDPSLLEDFDVGFRCVLRTVEESQEKKAYALKAGTHSNRTTSLSDLSGYSYAELQTPIDSKKTMEAAEDEMTQLQLTLRESKGEVTQLQLTFDSMEDEMTQFQLTLDTSKVFQLRNGKLTPSFLLGVHYASEDGENDEDTESGGAGLELSGSFQYANKGFILEGTMRTFLTHEKNAYEEWEVSSTLRIDPGQSGRGLSLSIQPTWSKLSDTSDRFRLFEEELEGFDNTDYLNAEKRLEAELGYGMKMPSTDSLLTPYVSVSWLNTLENISRSGLRWNFTPETSLSFEAVRNKGKNKAFMLNGNIEW